MTAWMAVALCLLPLIGPVQVWPVGSTSLLDMKDLGFGLLAGVSCREDINFTSPANVTVKCHNAALGLFIKEFKTARNCCKDEDQHVIQTMEELQRVHSAVETWTECTLATNVHQSFADFVKAAKEFAEKFNSAQSQRKTH